MEFDDPTIHFDIPDPVDLGLTLCEDWRQWPPTEKANHIAGWAFHKDNPAVAYELRSLALELLDAGNSHHSIKGLWEVLRFNKLVKTTGKPYKLNNNLTPFYARLLMENEPRLAGFFHTRESK